MTMHRKNTMIVKLLVIFLCHKHKQTFRLSNFIIDNFVQKQLPFSSVEAKSVIKYNETLLILIICGIGEP